MIRHSTSYDPATDSLYISVSDKPSSRTREIFSNVMVDYNDVGEIVGYDIQHASSKTFLVQSILQGRFKLT